jgi:hypothetical protein
MSPHLGLREITTAMHPFKIVRAQYSASIGAVSNISALQFMGALLDVFIFVRVRILVSFRCGYASSDIDESLNT